MKKVNIISLGCSKNLVDTEMLLKQLDKAGYMTEVDVENSDAEVVVVNTCGFIESAKEEAINTIFEIVELKKKYNKKVVVTGCLVERYLETLKEEIPEVLIKIISASFVLLTISTLFFFKIPKIISESYKFLAHPKDIIPNFISILLS